MLVIDDDPLILECFRVLFGQAEATVATAKTAAEGLNLFTEKRPGRRERLPAWELLLNGLEYEER